MPMPVVWLSILLLCPQSSRQSHLQSNICVVESLNFLIDLTLLQNLLQFYYTHCGSHLQMGRRLYRFFFEHALRVLICSHVIIDEKLQQVSSSSFVTAMRGRKKSIRWSYKTILTSKTSKFDVQIWTSNDSFKTSWLLFCRKFCREKWNFWSSCHKLIESHRIFCTLESHNNSLISFKSSSKTR